MKTVLITGFTPFGGEDVNPSYEAVKAMKTEVAGARVVKKQISTVFGKSLEELKAAMDEVRPDYVICVGQAGGRFDITVERVAINLDDARIADNEGNQPLDQAIVANGENAYFTTLPVKAMVKRMQENSVPGSVSYTAGTFVCNHIMYGLLHFCATERPGIKGGFIHVPFIPEQVVDKRNMPYMSLELMTKGLELCVEAAVAHDRDISEIGGEIC